MKRIFGAFSVMAMLALQLFSTVPQASATTSFWCDDGHAAPCIEAVSRNGTPLTSGDPDYGVVIGDASHGHDFQWNISRFDAAPLSPLTDQWVVKIDTGTEVPRVAFTHGDNVTVERSGPNGSGEYKVEITANPVVIVGECDQTTSPWTCPRVATTEWDGYLDGEVFDFNFMSDPAERDSTYGLEYSSNISATEIPPQIVGDATTGAQHILVQLANPHFLMDRHTVFTGFVHQRIPNAFLRVVYGIDAPATLTTGGLDPVVSGPEVGSGTLSVSEDPGGGAMLVDATGLTFSARRLIVHRGVITPTRPLHPQAIRLSPGGGRIKFDPATPRGSRITGYRVRCVAPNGSTIQVASPHGSPIAVSALHGNTPYDCTVRANSKAGLGAPTAKFRMPAHA